MGMIARRYPRHSRIERSSARLWLQAWAGGGLLLTLACSAGPDVASHQSRSPTSAEEVIDAFSGFDRTVLTFVGYSGAGYEEPEMMLRRAAQFLSMYDPGTTIVNIGATPDGIGAVYALAKERGFTTVGIVSALARDEGTSVAPHVDRVFFVGDDSWGGLDPRTGRLSPTSRAMVECSDVVVGIGGGAVARDELLAAREAGKEVHWFPADMDHERAIARAMAKGMPVPTDFGGEAHAALGDGGR